ncbi:hypothetical protein F4820DRAFT_444287 [Hypoxylon rubiginosum]|uniref:Uncharacterized protein n=1 Tax=Hypoxylon rubiginosum TaxID=110542 RepID=A0ACB9ZC75_9PEZI|nr:hypothetical protein F4820DRAFT_444287 [Hypoxylon rubiginosum]
MSTTRKTARSVTETSEGFISDNDNIIGTPLTCGDSLYDVFSFEDIDPPFASDHVVVEDVAAPVKKGPTNPGQSRLKKGLSEVRRIIDWIMGRDLVVGDHQVPVHTTGEPILAEREDSGGRQLVDDFVDIGDVQDTCPACTTPYCQAVDSLPFRSSLRLNYNDPEMHTWSIGDKYIMTEAVDTEPSEDTDVTLALAADLLKSTRVPIPNVMAGWKEGGKVITIVERAPGQRLYDIWWDLSRDDRERIAREVADHVDQWRRLKADRISGLSGGSAYHKNLFGKMRHGFGPFRSDEQLWKSIKHQLEKKKVDGDVIRVLEDYMPGSAPCVFTHGDLSCTNILIHDGKVSAILGFDNAACLPVWAESIAVHFCYCQEDEQWKAILSKHMKSYARAKDWWSLWMAVEENPLNRKRIAALVARCRRWPNPPKEKRPFDTESRKDEQTRQASSRSVASKPKSQLRSPHRTNPPAQKARDPFSTALSRKLLKGRHYSELLNDQYWELAIVSQSEVTGGMGVFEGNAAVLERELQEWEDQIQDDRRVSNSGESQEEVQEVGEEEEEEEEEEGVEEEGNGGNGNGNDDNYYDEEEGGGAEEEEEEDDDDDDEKGKEVARDVKRTRIERWLLESERGRKVFSRPFLEQESSERGETPYPSAVKDLPWRERQRSFERADNTSKGLRPFSLPLSHLSESAKQNLRETGGEKKEENEEENEEEPGDDNREVFLEKTLQSLESRSGDNATSAAAAGAASVTASGSDSERKRISIFRERNMPGLLYLAVANTAAEGRAKRYQRSQSAERAWTAEDQAASRQRAQQRPRPHSLMPQARD